MNEQMTRVEIGERMRKIRRMRHLTQREIGEVLGMSANTVSQYESGQREPSLTALKSFCDYCGTDLNVLIGFSGREGEMLLPELTEEEIRMIEGYRRRKDSIRQVIRFLCFDGEQYRSPEQEKREALVKAHRLLKENHSSDMVE